MLNMEVRPNLVVRGRKRNNYAWVDIAEYPDSTLGQGQAQKHAATLMDNREQEYNMITVNRWLSGLEVNEVIFREERKFTRNQIAQRFSQWVSGELRDE